VKAAEEPVQHLAGAATLIAVRVLPLVFSAWNFCSTLKQVSSRRQRIGGSFAGQWLATRRFPVSRKKTV